MDNQKILSKIRSSIDLKHKNKKFMPGETYITASGQYFDGDDVATLVECVLGVRYLGGIVTG